MNPNYEFFIYNLTINFFCEFYNNTYGARDEGG